MDTVFKHKEIEQLWQLAGIIGDMAERTRDDALGEVYIYLSKVLDICEQHKLYYNSEDY